MGVSKMVGLQGKIPLKWMMTGGTPILENSHMLAIVRWFSPCSNHRKTS